MDRKKISAGKITIIAIVAILLILALMGISSYNNLTSGSENVNSKSATIDTQLQRRLDLVPNLVNTVKGYATHEQGIISEVSEARAKLAGAGTMGQKAEADAQLTGALSRLMVVVENYPTLKANEQFAQLIDELSGTENRISVARKDYNDAVNNYNRKTKTFPSVIYAKIFGFKEASYYEASETAKNSVPEVKFG